MTRLSTRAVRSTAAALLLLVAGGSPAIAGVTTKLSPTPDQPGDVIRDDQVTINVVSGAMVATRDGSGTYAWQASMYGASVCGGDNPSGTNNSPRSEVIVTGPSGVVLDATSPVKNVSIASLMDGSYDKPTNPQPGPNDTNYRGGPWSTALNLAGRPAGTYTVQTINTNKVHSGGAEPLACTTGTPTGAAGVSAYTPGPYTETLTFTYQPWQQLFVDASGGGSVRFNTSPDAFTFSVGGASSPVVKGAEADAAITQVASVVYISWRSTTTSDYINGVFDIGSHTFTAVAQAGGIARVLTSTALLRL
jgi:hypothetical protein